MKKTDYENYRGIYDPTRERDACGIGAVVNIDGRQEHQVVTQALDIVEKLEHRAGKDAEGKTGDGVGIMLQISHDFFVFCSIAWHNIAVWVDKECIKRHIALKKSLLAKYIIN